MVTNICLPPGVIHESLQSYFCLNRISLKRCNLEELLAGFLADGYQARLLEFELFEEQFEVQN